MILEAKWSTLSCQQLTLNEEECSCFVLEEGKSAMPMMAAYEQNDARDAARMLAHRTLAGIRAEDNAAGNAIENMYRLLQGYRSHGFYGYGEKAPSDDEASLSLMMSTDRNVGELKLALDHAFVVVFDDADRGAAIDRMKQVFLSSAYPEEGARAEPADREQTEQFLKALLDSLEA